jgi:hypothetical protein
MVSKAIFRNFVTFDSDSLDDSEWDEDDNLVVPGGRAVLTAVANYLTQQGFACSDNSSAQLLWLAVHYEAWTLHFLVADPGGRQGPGIVAADL